jgi:hypothetical protein
LKTFSTLDSIEVSKNQESELIKNLTSALKKSEKLIEDLQNEKY